MLNLSHPETAFALRSVQQAGRLARQIQAEMVSPALTKDDRSPVTVADFALQAVVARQLSLAFPNDPLIGEESSGALQSPEERQTLERITEFVARIVPEATPESVCIWIDRGAAELSGRFWTLDPIDGTKGFLRHDQYAIALALLVDGQVELGVLGCPNLRDGYIPDHSGPGSLVVARRGEGTWVTSLDSDLSPASFRQLHVSNHSESSRARLLRSFEAGHTNVSQLDVLAERLGVTAEPVRMDSQAKYAILAAGHGDVIVRLLSPKALDYKEKIWDQAAGAIVTTEAGGQMSDLSGKALDFSTGRMLINNRGVLGTNRLLHPAFLQGLAEIGA